MKYIPLVDVCDFQGGSQPPKDQWISEAKEGYIRMLQIRDFTQSEKNNIEYVRISNSIKTCNEDDILIGRYGASVGKILTGLSGAYNVAIIKTIPDEQKISKRFLYYYLNSLYFQNYILSVGSRAAQAGFNKEDLSEAQIPDISLEEQNSIVLSLDKIDMLIYKRKQQLLKLDELVKSRFVELFGEITESVPVSYYIKALTAGKSLAGEEECANKVLKTGAATYDEFDATQVKNLPVDYTPVPEHLLKDGDIIISRMNTAELVGATAYVWRAPRNTYLPDRLWRAELQPDTNAIFVWQMLIQPSTKEQIRREASGTSGSMKNISKPGLLGLQVKKAPIELQNQFATFVEQTDKSKLAVQKSLEQLEILKKSLMQQYFG